MLDLPSLAPLSALICLALGYLLGSIPFGILLTRAFGAGDLRKIGSGNIGATNVLRTGRKGLAAATLVGDALKGTIAVIVCGWLFGGVGALVAGLGAFLGHLFPVWLGFKGGKGVATYLGILLGVAWQGFIVFALVWLGMAFVFRYSSLSALTAAVITPPALWLLGYPGAAQLFVLLSVALILKHHENIRRLLRGEESKINLGPKS